MSLMRQLWLAVIASTVFSFAVSLLVSVWSAQGYLTQQLERKNGDIANSLALSMTQQNKDAVTVELQLTALFDTGYYQQPRCGLCPFPQWAGGGKMVGQSRVLQLSGGVSEYAGADV